ncbi:hypothetical protein BN1012_Phect495 [Candidatus Phaeomarinobacter ectocarpi]|uniref:YARHG domain-containing protein n=1 Tax=Candidatus Phaeomarinibacter ectocarpi TaxID=1458461 RepID=X5MDS2_9HYPH|nr:hypothetical protein [Candidatus Phaeomarinobacter ectocarpi]CDO58709.1 hypothetical protein BN1012_Phect495 [Candidatus Phaeomarinobacter ectocarpi]
MTEFANWMKNAGAALSLATSIFLAGTAGATAQEETPELLSADVNRLEQMMKDCTDKRKAGMSIEQCSCFFEEAVDHDISNVDIGYYVGGRSEWSNISDNSTKMDMAGLQIECLGSATTAFYDRTVADYKARLEVHEREREAARGGSGGGSTQIEPLDPPVVYKASAIQGYLSQCPIIYWREPSYCTCIIDESQRYFHQPEFEVMFNRHGLALGELKTGLWEHFEGIRGQCEADYTGKKITTTERAAAIDAYTDGYVRKYEPIGN